jgi:hypothetical protein
LVDGFVEFEIPNDVTYGNALIAVKNASGTILWSWHIWLCDFDPEYSAQKYSSGYSLMDRNLGATLNNCTSYDELLRASGTLYQWGRKDPLTAWTLTGYAGMQYDLQYISENPTVFVGTNYTRWLEYEGVLRGLWSSGEKDIYDPCPPGWIISSPESWASTRTEQFNEYCLKYFYDSSNTTILPYGIFIDMAGCQSSDNQGRMWIADAYDTHIVVNYNMYNGEIEVSYGGPWTTNAFSVRCMKDMGIRFADLSVELHVESAVFHANIESKYGLKIEDKGFVWEYDECIPTIGVAEQDSLGPGPGRISAKVENLMTNPTYSYYMRAYVIVDGAVKYSKVLDFKTPYGGSGDIFTEDDYEW